jgi:D-glycero-D-manno-heptose 1,7-bisphosphate phosphatase
MNKSVFLDRDGVINKRPNKHDYVKSWAEFELLPDVIPALKILKENGYLIVVISNQRGVARGLMTPEDVIDIHSNLNSYLNAQGTGIDAFYFCPHDYSHTCTCRKPAPGLINQAVKELNIDLAKSCFIGDSDNDRLCGKNAGVLTKIISPNSSLLPWVEYFITYGTFTEL